MVIGTFCRLSSRRCAVTITSCNVSVAVPVSSGAASTIVVAGALRIAATAAEIFGLGFIAHAPPRLVVIFPRQMRLPAR